MKSMSRKQLALPVTGWLLGSVTIVIIILMGVLAFRIYGVFVDPLTVGHRWTIIDGDWKLLLSLVLIVVMLVPALQLSYLRAKIDEARPNDGPLPSTWSAIERAMMAEEEREGRIAQRYPKFLSHMVKAFETPCTKDGVIVKALVFARHENLVLLAPLENPSFFLGDIDDKGKVSCSQQFPKISQAIEAFLGRVAGVS